MTIASIWQAGPVCCEVPVVKPILASWDAKNAPSQILLNAYLSELIPKLKPMATGDEPLFLHFRIGVADPAKLLVACDLENYLYPLFGARWLPSSRFVLVSAAKRVGASHCITIGKARAVELPSNDWHTAKVAAGSGYTTKSWKERVRDRLQAETGPLTTGAADVQIAFRCAGSRTWPNLWKPAGDCMGPILGESRSYGFNPCDDRIVDLKLHRMVDDNCGHDIELQFWWRPASV